MKEKTVQTSLFQKNSEWATGMVARDPKFFEELAARQKPKYLWIGCSDSRVSPNELLGLLPGELFVHRNIANVVAHGDLNCLSVLQFAVDLLKVAHIFVVGHYGCSGVHAALTKCRVGLVDNWLRYVDDVQQKHRLHLNKDLPEGIRYDRLCELNSMEQAANVCRTTIVQDAWRRGQSLTIHSWMYGLHDGLLRDLGVTVSCIQELSKNILLSLSRYEL
jgi:carbonic anhydrase